MDAAPSSAAARGFFLNRWRCLLIDGWGPPMINGVIEFSAKNKQIIFLLTAVAALAGWWSMQHLPLDAIPDLSDTQVIVYSRWDGSPDIVEDQVTYPIVTAMLGAPRVRAVPGFSDFGYSYVLTVQAGPI